MDPSLPECDKAILDRMYPIIKAHEKNIEYPYKDIKGNITVGIGKNIHQKEIFDTIRWQNAQGNPITREEADKYYQTLLALPQNNMKAEYYMDKTPLRISPEESQRLYEEHMKNDLMEIRKTFNDFDKLSESLQNVVLDIKFHRGNVNEKEWPNLHKGIKEKNLDIILKNVSRKGFPDRNEWAIDEIRKIKKWD